MGNAAEIRDVIGWLEDTKKYQHDIENNFWPDAPEGVEDAIVGAVDALQELVNQIQNQVEGN